nr:glycosyltransferase [Herbiconiux flava]
MLHSAPPGVTVTFFDWKNALHGHYDVLHIHWPEFLVRGVSKRDALLSLVRLPRLLRKLKRDRIGVVRTLHNLTPHESGHPLEARLTAALDGRVHKYIALNPVTTINGESPELILHGDYVERFSVHPRAVQQPGRVLYFGLVRPYKGIDTLIDRFAEIDTPGLSLRIVGRPNSDAMRRLVLQAEADDPRVSARLEFVADKEMVAEVTAAQLIVLPYREMHNSGILLVALSLGRPVLTLDTPVNRSISQEVGPGWIWFYTGELSSEIIEGTLEEVAALDRPGDAHPTFDSRDWASVGRKHGDVYRKARDMAKGR